LISSCCMVTITVIDKQLQRQSIEAQLHFLLYLAVLGCLTAGQGSLGPLAQCFQLPANLTTLTGAPHPRPDLKECVPDIIRIVKSFHSHKLRAPLFFLCLHLCTLCIISSRPQKSGPTYKSPRIPHPVPRSPCLSRYSSLPVEPQDPINNTTCVT
jgi:hypothetical protein